MGNEASPLVRGGPVASGPSEVETTSSRSPTPGKRALVDLQQATRSSDVASTTAPSGSASSTDVANPPPAMSRARSLVRLARTHLLTIESVLLPAYQGAVAATDTAAVRALVQQLVGGVARVIDAQAQLVKLVPQVDRKATAALASTAATDPGPLDAEQLAMLQADADALDRELIAAIGELVIKVSPQMFGVMPTAGFGSGASERTFVHFVSEAELVVELMGAADQIAALAVPTALTKNASRAADDAEQDRAVEQLSRWKSRPVNFYFLQRLLKQRGVWALIAGHDERGRTARELERLVDAQAQESGPSADLAAWDEDGAGDTLGAGRLAWPVSDDRAVELFHHLTELDADARAGAIKQLASRGVLGRLCLALPWPAIKQLWEVTPEPRAAKLLEPYWLGKGDAKSLGRMLDGNAITRGVSKFLDFATIGAKPKIDAAIDSFAAGEISDTDVASQASGSVTRAAFVAAATAATGGVAGAYVGGAALGAGFGEGAAVIAEGAAAGSFGSVGGQLAGDVYDQARGDKQGFDPISSYATGFAGGGLVGTLLAPLGLAAARYLPAGMRTIAQQAAASHPEWTRVLDAVRSVGIGTTTTVRLTVREVLASMRNGGPPGFRFAYVTSGGVVPPAIAHADPSASVLVTARPLTNLNVSAGAFRWGDDLLEVEGLSFEDQIREHIADVTELHDAPHTMDEEGSLAGDESRLGEDGPEVAAVGARRTRRDAGMVSDEGKLISAQHHVFPQEHRAWFESRGVDIDEYCVVTTEVEHQAQHGGGSHKLARQLAMDEPSIEWNAAMMERLRNAEALKKLTTGNPRARLNAKEIIHEGLRQMESRGLGNRPFTRYQR